MGRRSRKRTLAPGDPRPAPTEAPPAPPRRPPPALSRPAPRAPPPRAPPRAVSRRARLDEAPKAPWSPFPLVELCILVGLALMVTGFVSGGNRGGLFVVCGVGLVGGAPLGVGT